MTKGRWRWAYRAGVVGVVGLGLAACGGMPRNERPAQVESRGAEPVPRPEQRTPQIAAYTPPAMPTYARPAPNRAVEMLSARADDQRRSGDLVGASASLERALRIAPDDALLWNRLARVRLDQGRYDLVAQLAAKSNSLADPADTDLRRANWTLIATARDAQGDPVGAREARRRAAR